MTATEDSISPPPYAKMRARKRLVSERSAADAVLDEAKLAHVGFIADGRPMVIPMLHARVDDTLYIHGAKATRIIKRMDETAPICLTVTLLDGIVVARSAFHHSMNYRSVIVHGQARHVADAQEKDHALVALTNRLLPGRWDEVRPMTAKERNATGVLAVSMDAVTMKQRSGPPVDDDEDYALPIWAGVIDLQEEVKGWRPDARLLERVSPPHSLSGYLIEKSEET